MRPEALEVLTGSDLILHAGDVGRDEVLDALEAIAPVVEDSVVGEIIELPV